MCGIAGIVHRDRQRPVAEATVRAMCDAIRHRGPDDEGLHVAGPAGIGMRRLSIIDLATGHQPIYNEDRSKVIVFNGEIYNYRELRRGLIDRGHRMTTHSDSETILHLYEELGSRCVERLRGMFAFAIWDQTRGSLLLARDRFGIKPLYVTEAPWGLAFASEIKALLAVGASSRALDWNALDAYFQIGYIPSPMTPFLDVRKLEPGCVLEWHDGRATTTRYWDLPRTSIAVPSHIEEMVIQWLDDSVKAHLESDVPIAAFLSGGLDSSAVFSSMAIAGSVPHAFTARYHGTGAEAADETPLARALVDRYGARLTVVDIEPDVAGIFEAVVNALDEPQADESSIPTWLISQAVAAEYKVVLSGTGGDELFAGYRRHQGLMVGGLLRRLPAPVRRIASAAADLLPEPRGAGLGIDRLKRFLRTPNGTPPDRFLGYLSKLQNGERKDLYAPPIRDLMSGTAAEDRFGDLYREGGSPEGLRAGLYLDYRAYLPDDILMLSDRIAMAHSLEIRVPFVDHELVEAIYPLPDRLKIGLGRQKRLLRRALQSRLPAAHFTAPKRGFVGPTAAWLRHELRDMVTDELAEARMSRMGYFDGRAISSLVADHMTRRHNREGILWSLLCFSTWHRLTIEKPAVPAYTT